MKTHSLYFSIILQIIGNLIHWFFSDLYIILKFCWNLKHDLRNNFWANPAHNTPAFRNIYYTYSHTRAHIYTHAHTHRNKHKHNTIQHNTTHTHLHMHTPHDTILHHITTYNTHTHTYSDANANFEWILFWKMF